MQSSIISKTIREAVKLLKATGAKYVVIDQEGNQFSDGSLSLAPTQTRSRKSLREYGSLSTYYTPYLRNTKVGEVACIPLGDFAKEPEALRGSASAWCSINWGNNSHKTCITKTAVEILRTA